MRDMKKKKVNFNKALSDESKISNEDWIIRIGFFIHDCARLRHVVLDEVFKPLKITRSQAWLIAYLSGSEGIPQSALAEQMGLGKVALGGLIDRLESNKFIERRSDPLDRRVNNIFFTPKGREIVDEMRKLTLEANKDILKGISIDEVKSCIDVLRRLKHNLKVMKDSFTS